MRKVYLFFLVTLFLRVSCYGQSIWSDTVRKYVDLRHFKLGKKVVEAGYGKAIMYFSQKDYLGKEMTEDTFKILPRFFKEYLMSKLMKDGKVMVIERENNSVMQKISHRLVQYASMCNREFELEDGTHFFSVTEISGIMLDYNFDTTKNEKQEKSIPKKKFEEPEEFPNTNDHEKIKFRDYFPTDTMLIYVYGARDGYGDLDTIGCKETVYEGQKIFYFPYLGYHEYNIVDIGATMFGGGFYFFKNDSLFVVEADDESDLKPDVSGLRLNVPHIKDAALLIPSYMIPGDSVIILREFEDDNKQVYTYLSKEDVKIGKLIYSDCIKFKMLSYWDDAIYLSYIWFKKDMGMIKWDRGTGRIDELIHQYRH